MPADHGTPNTGDERDREVEAVAAAYGREAFESGDARLAAAAAIDALDAIRSWPPQGEDHDEAEAELIALRAAVVEHRKHHPKLTSNADAQLWWKAGL